MYIYILALAVVGASASNQTECLRVASRNYTEKMSDVVHHKIDRAYSGNVRNATERTHEIINMTSSVFVQNITEALQPLLNSNTTSAVIVNSARVALDIKSQYHTWVVGLNRLGSQIGSDGGFFFAQGIASTLDRAVGRVVRDLRLALLDCIRRNKTDPET